MDEREHNLEEVERELARLRLARPPAWLKAGAVIAAQNACANVLRRRRRWTSR